MGVPSFYRWLTRKYPNIFAPAVEEKGGGEGSTVDTSLPNPNGMEFDNLYLDMNGIIHPCFHPDDTLFPPVNFEEVYQHIFEYIDRLFNIVRPRKLLYMAIDGVAPRAKMNQQRARRFRTSKDNEVVEKEEERLRKRFEKEGKYVQPKEESEVSDSNVITPGTLFMYRLSKELQRYICTRMENDPGWKQIKVILSDANVPGEGEHKIMSFIRSQRTIAGYNPNTRHCLYGLDADLIMLVLATHEIHFSIVREGVLVQIQKPICVSALETTLAETETCKVESRGWFQQHVVKQITEEDPLTSNRVERTKSSVKKPYQFLQVWILRDYLEHDIKITNLPKTFQEDFERIIDDFIFLCFFAGNDFLPHMPSLEINEGSIDLLMHVYKEEFEKFGGYLVDLQRVDDNNGGYIKLKRVEKFILSVGKFEEQIFKKRAEIRERSLRRVLAESEMARDDEEEDAVSNLARSDRVTSDSSEILQNTKQLKEELKSYTRKLSDAFKNGISTDKVRMVHLDGRHGISKKNSVQIHLQPWKARGKSWFYPFHYGPFASDMKGLAQTNVRFKKSSPFKPFDQLLGVLPPKSAHAMPTKYQMLMTDEQSSIIDFYPTDFEIDVDGKRFQWQGICKLDFIDEKRLLAETKKIESELNEEEAKRNSQTDDHLFVRSSSALGANIMLLLRKDRVSMDRKDAIEIDTSLSGEIYGFVRTQLYDSVGVDSDGGNVLCVHYKLPPYSLHIPRLLEGVHIPEKTVSEVDIEKTQLWHEYQGSRQGYRFPDQQNPRKFVTTSKSSEAAIKYAGVGWNAEGCGKVSHSFNAQDKFTRLPGGCSEFTTSSTRELKGASTSRGETSFAYKSSKEYKSLGYNLAESRGLEDLRISDPRQRFKSDVNPQQANNSFKHPFGRVHEKDGGFTEPVRRDNYQPYQPPSARAARANIGFNSNQEWRESSVWSNVPNRIDMDQRHSNQVGAAGFHGRGQYRPNSGGGTSSARSRGRYAPSNSFDTSARGRGRYAPSNSCDTSSAHGRGRYAYNSGFNASSAQGYTSNSRW